MRVLLLSLTMSLCTLPANAKYSGGTGEPNDPYQIATAGDLIALGETPEDYDKYFVLTANIDLDPNLPGRKVFDKALIAADTDLIKPDFQGTPFTGVFDGNGHTISRLTIKGGGYLGLFGRVYPGAEIKNLGIVGINVTASGSYVGGLAGENSGFVTRCHSTGVVTGNGRVGGLIGFYGEGEDYSHVAECYSTGMVEGNDSVGGLIGGCILPAGGIRDCYSIASVSGRKSVGGLIGESIPDCGGKWSGSCYCVDISRCYSAGPVAGESGVGGLVGSGSGVRGSSFWDTQTSGQAGSSEGTGKTTADMQDPNMFMAAGWDFVGQPDGPHDIWAEPTGGGYPILWWQLSPLPKLFFSGGTGEPDDPYRISMPTELNSIGYNPRLMGAHFKLVNDVDLGGIDFYVIGSAFCPFIGSFNGNGHRVSHLTIAGERFLGLFGWVKGEVKNLGVVDVNIVGANMVGSGFYIGALVGWNDGVVANCYSTGVVRGRHSVGGLVGHNQGTVTHCYSTGAVTGGGLVGENGWGASVIHCYSTGVVGGDDPVGGLVGDNNGGVVTACF